MSRGSLGAPVGDMTELEYREGFPVLDVWQVVEALNGVLADVFPFAWVRGEVSGLKRSYAGHLYFSLKDDLAQLNCVCFRGDADALPFDVEDGQQLLCGGVPEVYKDRGSLQLIVRRMEPEGAGALALAFEQLKNRLEAEGLFSDEHKRAVPARPELVGVVTSPTGAVIQDILNVSARRHPGINILISPTRVQGQGAADEISAAIAKLAAREPDVIIVARGGGSLEDLWAFNEEVTARAIFECPVPVVSAVGHETDFTIADFVADVRAPTPSAAAEIVFPSLSELVQNIEHLRARLLHPGRKIELKRQHLDDLTERLSLSQKFLLGQYRDRLLSLTAQLRTLNPMNVLDRGYAIASLDGKPISSIAGLKKGNQLSVTLLDGKIAVTIDEIEKNEP